MYQTFLRLLAVLCVPAAFCVTYIGIVLPILTQEAWPTLEPYWLAEAVSITMLIWIVCMVVRFFRKEYGQALLSTMAYMGSLVWLAFLEGDEPWSRTETMLDFTLPLVMAAAVLFGLAHFAYDIYREERHA